MARMSVLMKSFERIRPGNVKSVKEVGLPTKSILFTVNRGPNIDKKSRDQFAMVTRKRLLVMDMEVDKMREMYSVLKHHNLIGVQLKVNFQYKTRLGWYANGPSTEPAVEDQKQVE